MVLRVDGGRASCYGGEDCFVRLHTPVRRLLTLPLYLEHMQYLTFHILTTLFIVLSRVARAGLDISIYISDRKQNYTQS